MTGKLLYSGDHRCDPPGDRAGAIWRCDCGAVWRGSSPEGQVWLRVTRFGRWLLRRRGILDQESAR